MPGQAGSTPPQAYGACEGMPAGKYLMGATVRDVRNSPLCVNLGLVLRSGYIKYLLQNFDRIPCGQ